MTIRWSVSAVMEALALGEWRSAAEIADGGGTGSLAVALTHAYRRGWVERRAGTHGGPRTLYRITTAGRARLIR